MNILQLLTHAQLSMMIKTMKCLSQHNTTSAEQRKVDETAKEARAHLPLTTFSNASSARPENETHEQFTRFTIQARIARTRAEAPQDVSSTFSSCEDGRRARREQGKTVDDEKWRRKIFTSHTSRPRCKTFPENQDVRYGKHTHELRTDRKTRQLTGASRKISPM